ncbi:dimethylarginine dimethylaminohydrolase family protein [Salicibibacter kimchii]|uniref:N(G),N(G)-dimethylarginine dimethylaminohydrolase n=1 Tax=Salicibibacter kimchii TaxID=2099786 RepID=A0A345BY39_9BACI|nr:arginine deiminase-related protein [Salicibibacter kimchii]AXF55870.1 N(G),N(G)-dimethylarginine dimethylaminohydrolase [Salicibibacter kimchii]
MFSKAIVRKVGDSYVDGLNDASLGTPDIELARAQHKQYVEALETCGLEVTVLEEDERYPDAIYVEDPAVVTAECAILTNPGAPSRTGEKDIIEPILKRFYDNIESISDPGHMDGGDVIHGENHYYIGLSDRTNREGAEQFRDIVKKYGCTTSFIPVHDFLHLKTGATYIGDDHVLVAGEFVDEPAFSSLKKIVVPDNEAYAANCLRIKNTIIMPKGFTETYKQIKALGLQTIEVEASEFQKKDGSLTCLSLRF